MRKNKDNSQEFRSGFAKINTFLSTGNNSQTKSSASKQQVLSDHIISIIPSSKQNLCFQIGANNLRILLEAYNLRINKELIKGFFVTSKQVQEQDQLIRLKAEKFHIYQLFKRVIFILRQYSKKRASKRLVKEGSINLNENKEVKTGLITDRVNQFLVVERAQIQKDFQTIQPSIDTKSGLLDKKISKLLNLQCNAGQEQKHRIRKQVSHKSFSSANEILNTTQPKKLKQEWRSPMSKSPTSRKTILSFTSNMKDKSQPKRIDIARLTKQNLQREENIYQFEDVNNAFQESLRTLKIQPEVITNLKTLSSTRSGHIQKIHPEAVFSAEKENKLKNFLSVDYKVLETNKLISKQYNNWLLKRMFFFLKANLKELLHIQKTSDLQFLKKYVYTWVSEFENNPSRIKNREALEQVKLQIIRKVFYSWYVAKINPQKKSNKSNKVIANNFRNNHLLRCTLRAWLRQMQQFEKKTYSRNSNYNHQSYKYQ